MCSAATFSRPIPAQQLLDRVSEGYWYLANFWHQFGNSFIVGLGTTLFTLLIGSLTSFVIGRMRIRGGWVISNLALVTYIIPASFVAIPYYMIMQHYGGNNSCGRYRRVCGVRYAICDFRVPQYSGYRSRSSSTRRLASMARLPGRSTGGLFTTDGAALVAVGTFALLLAWNDYLYQFLLLSSQET